MTTTAVGNRRLLKLADYLDKADARHVKKGEPTYDQTDIRHDCGTPACALGHAHVLFSRNFRWWGTFRKDSTGSIVEDAIQFFGLAKLRYLSARSEYEELFASDGCDYANTAKAAAKYIRNFVKRRMQA